MIVLDASVLAIAIGDDSEDGDRARARLRGETLVAPEVVDLEVMSAWRRLISDDRRSKLALIDLSEMPLRRCSHTPLLERCWELRQNVTPCDASYVALAEALGVPLLTTDARLARAPGVRCEVEVFT